MGQHFLPSFTRFPAFSSPNFPTTQIKGSPSFSLAIAHNQRHQIGGTPITYFPILTVICRIGPGSSNPSPAWEFPHGEFRVRGWPQTLNASFPHWWPRVSVSQCPHRIHIYHLRLACLLAIIKTKRRTSALCRSSGLKRDVSATLSELRN